MPEKTAEQHRHRADYLEALAGRVEDPVLSARLMVRATHESNAATSVALEDPRAVIDCPGCDEGNAESDLLLAARPPREPRAGRRVSDEDRARMALGYARPGWHPWR